MPHHAQLYGPGIETFAIHSAADTEALRVRLANRTYEVGPAPLADSYLNRERILDVALDAGVDAIHSGYGLFSEDPAFVGMCADRGVTFIGPSPGTMLAIGHKLPARACHRGRYRSRARPRWSCGF